MRQFVLVKSGDADEMFAEASIYHAFDTEALVLPFAEEGVEWAGIYGLYIPMQGNHPLTENDYSKISGWACAGCGNGDALEILDLDADALWFEGNRVFHNLECVELAMQEIIEENSP